MAALHDSGRRSEALDLYMGLRKRLVTELGMEPMPELQQLQQRILAGPADRQRGHAWGLVPSMATRRP